MTFTKICVIIIAENKKGIDYMKKLYYGIVGKDVYEEWVIPENIVDVRIIPKGNGIFLQYLTEFDRKNKWATDIIKQYSGNLKASYYDENLGISYVELSGGRIGFSKCSKGDRFIPVIGRAIAICRATGEKIPDFI